MWINPPIVYDVTIPNSHSTTNTNAMVPNIGLSSLCSSIVVKTIAP
jgi:hypothetical protein